MVLVSMVTVMRDQWISKWMGNSKSVLENKSTWKIKSPKFTQIQMRWRCLNCCKSLRHMWHIHTVEVRLLSYFFCPSLHTIITLSNQLLVEKAVEKMNLRIMQESLITRSMRHAKLRLTGEKNTPSFTLCCVFSMISSPYMLIIWQAKRAAFSSIWVEITFLIRKIIFSVAAQLLLPSIPDRLSNSVPPECRGLLGSGCVCYTSPWSLQ